MSTAHFEPPYATRAALAAIQQQVPQKLADKLSDLLDQACDDAERLEHVPGITLNMNTWLQVQATGCSVCLGGATLVCRAGALDKLELQTNPLPGRAWHYAPQDVTSDYAKIFAINDLREGDVFDAFQNLYGYYPHGEQVAGLLRIQERMRDAFQAAENHYINDDDEGDNGFVNRLSWDQYRAFAAELRALGY